MTARADYISTFDYLLLRCTELPCKKCPVYLPCSTFVIQFKNTVYVDHTMSYSEGENING